MHTQKIRLLFLLVCLGCLFLCSCGLDDYYIIEPPTVNNKVEIGQEDEAYWSFTTTAVNALTSSQIMMKGTEVYYKVYPVSQEEDLKREIETINGTNIEYSENGINKIRNSSSNSYATLQFGASRKDIVDSSSSPEQWKLTLQNHIEWPSGSDPVKLLKAECNGTTVDVYIEKPSVTSTTNEYYINAYAVTVGVVSFQSHYSQLSPLGVLKFRVQ